MSIESFIPTAATLGGGFFVGVLIWFIMTFIMEDQSWKPCFCWWPILQRVGWFISNIIDWLIACIGSSNAEDNINR
jgi:hypothetical protein